MLTVRRLAFLATLFYASLMYHRQKKASRYALVSQTEAPATDQPQQTGITETNHDPQVPKTTYEMYPLPDSTYEVLSEPIQEIMTSDNIAELPAARD